MLIDCPQKICNEISALFIFAEKTVLNFSKLSVDSSRDYIFEEISGKENKKGL